MSNIYANIHPELKTRLLKFEAELHKRGIAADACNGYRSMAEQARLYAKGRTTPGPKVTNARPGSSPHNYGWAMDYVPVVYDAQRGRRRTYNVSAKYWIKFGLAAKAAGLRWGGTWKKFLDRPHVEWPGWEKLK